MMRLQSWQGLGRHCQTFRHIVAVYEMCTCAANDGLCPSFHTRHSCVWAHVHSVEFYQLVVLHPVCQPLSRRQLLSNS